MNDPLDRLIARINAGRPPGRLIRRADLVWYEQHQPTFYPVAVLWELQIGGDDPCYLRYLDDGRSLVHLDGTKESIELANRSFAVVVTEDNLAEYVLFFFANVGQGQLHVIDSYAAAAGLLTPESINTPQQEHTLSKLCPPTIMQVLPDGWVMHLTAHWDALLLALDVHVGRDGALMPLGRAPL